MSILYKRDDRFPDKVLIRDFVGDVCVDDIIESWKLLSENNMINPELKGIVDDLKNCNLSMNEKGYHKLLAFAKKQKLMHDIKIAVVSNEPSQIVFPMRGQIDQSLVQIKPFSGLQSAIDWIVL